MRTRSTLRHTPTPRSGQARRRCWTNWRSSAASRGQMLRACAPSRCPRFASGARASCPHRSNDARLAAFLDLLGQAEPVADPAGWLFTRLVDGCTVTAADLYIAGRAGNLLEHARGRLAVAGMLDRWNPEWRTTTHPGWKVATNSDGGRVLTRQMRPHTQSSAGSVPKNSLSTSLSRTSKRFRSASLTSSICSRSASGRLPRSSERIT